MKSEGENRVVMGSTGAVAGRVLVGTPRTRCLVSHMHLLLLFSPLGGRPFAPPPPSPPNQNLHPSRLPSVSLFLKSPDASGHQ